MDDGYFVGPRDIVFAVLRDFSARIREETGGQLVPSKCKWYNADPTAAAEIEDKSLLPLELGNISDGTCLATNGEIYRADMSSTRLSESPSS